MSTQQHQNAQNNQVRQSWQRILYEKQSNFSDNYIDTNRFLQFISPLLADYNFASPGLSPSPPVKDSSTSPLLTSSSSSSSSLSIPPTTHSSSISSSSPTLASSPSSSSAASSTVSDESSHNNSIVTIDIPGSLHGKAISYISAVGRATILVQQLILNIIFLTVYKYLVSDYNSRKIVTRVGMVEALLLVVGYCLKEGLERTNQLPNAAMDQQPLSIPVPVPVPEFTPTMTLDATTNVMHDSQLYQIHQSYLRGRMDESEINIFDQMHEERNEKNLLLHDEYRNEKFSQQQMNQIHRSQLQQQQQQPQQGKHIMEHQRENSLQQEREAQDMQIERDKEHQYDLAEQKQLQDERNKHIQIQNPQFSTTLIGLIQSICLFAICIRIAAPILQTLTSSFSEDTIHALSITFSILHLLLHDYSLIHSQTEVITSGSFSGSLSLNAAMFTAVLLASRLSNMEKVVVFILLAILCFSLYQPVAKIVYLRSRALFLASTILLAIIASILLWFLDKTLFTAYLIVVNFTWFVSPLALTHMTSRKNVFSI